MKQTFRTIALIAVLSIAAAGCEKEVLDGPGKLKQC